MKAQMIAAHDIGVFAAIAFGDPGTYKGVDLEIAGDELTWMQMAAVISQVFGHPVHYQTAPGEQDQHLEGAGKITAFFEREGYRADLASLRQLHPRLLDFVAWLKQADLRM